MSDTQTNVPGLKYSSINSDHIEIQLYAPNELVSVWYRPLLWESQIRTRSSETIFGNWKSFKNDEKRFWFHLKSSFLSQNIYICVLPYGEVEKRLDLKDKVNFKIYDVRSKNVFNTYQSV